MKNIIADLWNENIAPIENFGTHNPEIEERIRLKEKNKEKLDKVLNEKQRMVFENTLAARRSI